MKSVKLLGIIFVLLSGYANAAVVDLNAKLDQNAAVNLVSQAQTLTLNAGNYVAQVIDADPLAWSAWRNGAVVDCDDTGSGCRKGWLNAFGMYVGGETTLFGATDRSNRYVDPEAAFSAVSQVEYQFTLTGAPQQVTFFVTDGGTYTDNFGGLSIQVSPVPEASTIAMMTLGLGVAGFFARRKR